MLKKRIIPCLDIKDGRTVKGTGFIDLKDAGDPVELAQKYALQGADELVFLDITATVENRKTLCELVEKIATAINIPFTVGGGIRTVDDAALLIRSGADKVSINSAAYNNPALIQDIATRFGTQCVVVAIDAKQIDNIWNVFTNGGRTDTGCEVTVWAQKAVGYGAGEILLTSMDNDGARNGYAISLTNAVCDTVSIPVIASGGAGCEEDFSTLFKTTKASAALAAGIFHYNKLSIPQLKDYLKTNQIPVR
ncbi:MAG: imidazole glycerol phosphate synthase subunit HisF [Bacteroidetes bacterium 43-93]|nr:imidazole glycerol phosphate synthase subunit HisF [Bacteroidota bacterium]OJW98994.1 MAG: imidazole glycerol phosphate synthase subunit HisF [Bacteroidetes bacterium 43-93]